MSRNFVVRALGLVSLACGASIISKAEPAPVRPPPQASVTIDSAVSAKPYSRMIFGGFLEHFDHQVYGGVFDPGSPLSDTNGFRTDVLAALKELKTPVVRWPGGCFVSGYHWEKGVGRERKPVDDMAWGVIEPNAFGTDEFVALSRQAGWEPYICNNAGNGTIEEMRNWVEYCNGATGQYARLRAESGHAAPLGVRIWSIGNENWGGHEIGNKPIEQWAPFVLEAAKAMKAADPQVQLSAAAVPSREWTLPLLKVAGPYLDYISIHNYWLPLWGRNDMPDYLSCILHSEGPENSIAGFLRVLDESGYRGKIKIAYDEWNLRGWHHEGFPRKTVQNYADPEVARLVKAREKNDIASQYTMADALFSASFLNACLRHAEDVGMANIAPLVNTRGPLFVHPKGIVKRTHFHALSMYANRLQDRVAASQVTADRLTQGNASVAVVDAVATVDGTGGHWSVALVNRHPSDAVACTVKLGGALLEGSFKATVLDGDSPDAFNDVEHPERVTPRDVELRFSQGVVSLPPHSLSIVQITRKSLPLPGEEFEVQGHPCFLIPPAGHAGKGPVPWVWYAPTLHNLPGPEEKWMFERFVAAGIGVAGIDVGESYGSPQGRALFTALYQELVEHRGYSRKPCLLARSRGGLMLYNWASEHPDSVSGVAGIYPVCNPRSWPGLDKACGAYGLTAAQLGEQLAQHSPIERLAPLAKAGVPIFHIHGDVDTLVPLAENSGELARRYRELGGSMRLRVPRGQGHNMWEGFFHCEELVEFVLAHAQPAAEREPMPALFRVPPVEARPGAFWDWLNGNVDLDELTRELREMKEKGMSGAEIWDIGLIRPNPDVPMPAGPAFLGPESLKAINHAIDEADRLGLHLGMVASSSWNAGGSWIEPQDGMKGLYHSELKVSGPTTLAQALPLPANQAPKGTNGLPLYFKDVAVLAFPDSPDKVLQQPGSAVDLTGKLKADGTLAWEVPSGAWVIHRFVMLPTGQHLMVPSPNSNGLMIDHLDGRAAEKHFRHIMDSILGTRPSFDALRYMEVDSVEVNEGKDWTEAFVDEFRKRRGYDPIPYLPALSGWSFGDPQIAPRFLHDYRKTVSDLWIDGHYRASTALLNRYGLQLAAEAGHGGEPRAEPLQACGVADIPRGEFWNGARFWVVKEAASAAHVYGGQLVDAESFTGWRHWQDGPLEYKRLADTAFCDGLNRMTFHTFAHTPPQLGFPGAMYHAGEHFNVNSTWWPKAGPMLTYFSRCCYMLQRGLPVADVCFYYGDDSPNLVATRRIGPDSKRLDGDTCAHCGRPNPAPASALGAGYDYDMINAEAIQSRLGFKDGRLTLPHGVSYAVLVLPDRADMPLPVLEKLEALVRDGATLLGPRPSRDPSLADYPRRDEQVRAIAERLWGPAGEGAASERSFGKGRVIADRNRVRDVLQQQGIGPDFAWSSPGQPADLDYIHRRTPEADIYFVSNTRMEDAEADCVFRVGTLKAQLWFPDTGEIQSRTDCVQGTGGVKLRLRLPPAGSVFVVFGSSAAPTVTAEPAPATRETASLDLACPWEVKFPPNLGAPPSRTFSELVSWTKVPDEGIQYFSGTATYLKEFEVPAAMLAAGGRLELDLGQLRNVAEVTLNGKPLGIRWKPPYRYDVTGVVRAGTNTLAVEITNLWANRLAGDARLPQEKRITRLTQKVPLGGSQEAGLFGPVRLRASAQETGKTL